MKIIGEIPFAKHLAESGAKHGYFVFSDVPLFLTEARDKIRAAFGADERRLQSLDENFDPGDAVREASEASLFANKTLREFFSAKALGAKDAATLVAVASASAKSGSAVIVTTPKPGKAKFLRDLAKQFVVVELPDIPRGQFAGWISARAKKAGIELDEDVACFVAGMTEGDPSAASQEIGKLAMAAGQGNKIDLKRARASVFDSSRDDVFTLREAMAAGNVNRALQALRNLRASGTGEPLVVWAVTEEARALLALASNGRPWVPSREHMANLRDIAKRADQAELKSLLCASAKADWYAKGMRKRDPWQALERLALAIATLKNCNRLPKLPALG